MLNSTKKYSLIFLLLISFCSFNHVLSVTWFSNLTKKIKENPEKTATIVILSVVAGYLIWDKFFKNTNETNTADKPAVPVIKRSVSSQADTTNEYADMQNPDIATNFYQR